VGDTITTSSFLVSSVLNAIPATASSIQQSYLASGVAGTGPAFSATPSTTQTVTTATYTKVNLGTENFDTNNNFASSRFTPTIAGYYQLNASVYIAVTGGNPSYIWSIIYKNGAAAIYGNLNTTVGAGSGTDGIGISSGLLYMNGTTDYVESYIYAAASAGTINVSGAGTFTVFSGFLARGA
jgi:hypothetical protein